MAAAMREQVPIALLYQAANLHEHLKRALGELGARVVYDARAAEFDLAALSASGARVVVVNLDPEVEEEIEQLDELLAAEHLHVVFNDGEVSSRLDGWDQARWARHLAAKILGVGDLHPPRPLGAQSIPVRVQSAAPSHPDVRHPERGFELHGHELADALSADTGESLRRTRAALVTKEEPIAPTLDKEFIAARTVPSSERPTLEIPAGDLMQRIPTGGLRSTETAPSIGTEAPKAAATAPSANRGETREQVAAEFADVLRDFGFMDEGSTPTTPESALASASALEGDDEFSGSFESVPAASLDSSLAIEGFDDGAMIASDLDATLEIPIESIAAATPTQEPAPTAAADDPFAGFDLGGLSLEPLDEDPAAPSQRDAEPARGLDDMLVDLVARGDDGKNTAPAKDKPAPSAALSAKPAAPAAKAASATAQPPAKTELAPLAAAQRSAAKPRELSDFDLSGLSLEPLGDEQEAGAATTGRARFDTLAAKSEPAKPSAAAKPSAPPKPATPAKFSIDPVPAADDMSLPDLDFSLDDGALSDAGSLDMDEQKFLAEVNALTAQAAPAAPVSVEGPIKNVWVLGASIGGPEAVREFLAKVQPTTPALFLLAQHMGADFVDLMTQQLARVTTLRVRHVQPGDTVAYGEVIVVPLGQRLLVDAQGKVEFSPVDGTSSYSPSIDQVMTDVADRFGAHSGAIIFSGMAHDAIDGAQYMAARGGKIWVQDPATCVISSMVDGARDAGVVSFIGAPAELARQIMVQFLR